MFVRVFIVRVLCPVLFLKCSCRSALVCGLLNGVRGRVHGVRGGLRGLRIENLGVHGFRAKNLGSDLDIARLGYFNHCETLNPHTIAETRCCFRHTF